MLLSLLTQARLKVSTIKSKSLKEMPMGLEIYLISSLISNTFQFPKSFLEPTENYEEPKKMEQIHSNYCHLPLLRSILLHLLEVMRLLYSL